MVQVDGVDMVFSSLTSPGMVAASAAVLCRGGSFIEIGKRCGCTRLLCNDVLNRQTNDRHEHVFHLKSIR